MSPEEFDKWRVFPRLLVLVMAIATWDVIHWFMSIQDPTFDAELEVGVRKGTAGS